MNNHFDHISATEKLKAGTLKKAKHISWGAISSIAAILVVMIGISAFLIPNVGGIPTNNADSAPENSLYNDSVNSESYVIKEEIADITENDKGKKADGTVSDAAGDNHNYAPVESLEGQEKPLNEILTSPTTAFIETPDPKTTPTITDMPAPTKAPAPTPVATTTPYLSEGGLSVQVTERPAGYDEHIAANRETMYITADNVAAHDRASTDAPIKFTIPKGAQVIADRNFQRIWAYVHYEENGIKKYGFVLEEHLSTEKP